eukprot:9492079-Ditylum_brightwellii.AAC.2
MVATRTERATALDSNDNSTTSNKETPSVTAGTTNGTSATTTVAAYTNILWSGTLPAVEGFVATKLDQKSKGEQKRDARTLHVFLTNTSKPLMQLNEGVTAYAVLVNLPTSNWVRLVYGLGFGTSGIVSFPPIDGKMLILTGDGDKTLWVLKCLCLPASI